MQATEKAFIGKLMRMQRFFDRYVRKMFAINQSRARAELDELLEGLEQADAEQRLAAAESRQYTTRRLALRKALVAVHLNAIVAVARARDVLIPMLAGFRVPSTELRDSELVEVSLAIAAFADQHRALFLAEGFPDDFVGQLQANVHAFRAAGVEQELCRMDRMKATYTIGRLTSRGRSLARMLNVLVQARIDRNVRLKAEWRVVMGARQSSHAPHTA